MLPDTCTSSKVVSREKGDANCFTRKAFDSTNSEGRRTIVQPTSTNIEGRIVMVVNLLSYFYVLVVAFGLKRRSRIVVKGTCGEHECVSE